MTHKARNHVKVLPLQPHPQARERFDIWTALSESVDGFKLPGHIVKDKMCHPGTHELSHKTSEFLAGVEYPNFAELWEDGRGGGWRFREIFKTILLQATRMM